MNSEAKKHYTNKEDNISVYRFMENCGMHCKYKKNVRISHKIMLKKLEFRYKLFPEVIILPKSVSFNSYEKEDVLNGNVVEVVDDYGQVIAYKNPLLFKEQELLIKLIKSADKKTLAEIRKSILKEQGFVENNNGEIITEDEYNTLYKNADLEITEKTNRNNSFVSRGGRSLRKKKQLN
jgi:hypothetical protein